MDEELTKGESQDKYFTVDIENKSQCKQVLKLKVIDQALQDEKNRIVEKMRKDISVPGFRKGRVPEGFIRKNYDDEVQADAVQNLLTRVYQNVIESKGLRPLADPEFSNLNVEDGKGVSVDIQIEVKPDVEISNYTGIPVEMTKKDIGDTEVNEALEGLRKHMGTYKTVERESEANDYVVTDFAPYAESGEIDEKATQKNYGVELGAGNVIPEFREGLVGLKAGDERDITVKYQDDIPDKNLAGTSKKFHVKVVEVKEELLPELDDAFAKTVAPDVTSMDELKKRIQEDLEKEEESRYSQEVLDKIIDKIIENNEFEVPEAMVENYLASLIEESRRNRPQAAGDEEREKEIRKLFYPSAVRAVKRYFIMDSVAKQEKVKVTDEEIEKKLEAVAKETGHSLEDVRKMFLDPKHKRSLENDIMGQNVLNFLRESADIKAV